MRIRALTILVSIASLLFVACGGDDLDNEGETSSGNNSGTSNNGSMANNSTTANSGTSNNSTTNNNGTTTNNNTTTTNDMCTLPEPSITPVDSCAEGGYTECGWAGDCGEMERCQDVGSVPDSGVTCCITACRGEKELGEECSSLDECASGACIARNDDPAVCTRPCDTAADCSGDLECVNIPFLAYPMWCVTPRSN